MTQLLKQFGPLGLVVGMAVWCCWGYLSGETGFQLDQSGKLPSLDREQLTPELREFSPRDPFLARSEPVEASQTVPDLPMPEAEDRPPEALIAAEDVLAELKLEATFLDGERRVAVINRHAFHEGDALVHQLFKGLTCWVLKIEEDHVLLRMENETYALYYPDFGRTHFTHITSTAPAGDDWNLRQLWSWAIGRAGAVPQSQPADPPREAVRKPEGTQP